MSSNNEEIQSPPLETPSKLGTSDYRISDEPWFKKNVLKWAFYDLGNTIYSMVVVSLTITPLIYIMYFNQLGNGEDAINRGNFTIAAILFISNIIMAFVSPFLGAYSDQKQERKSLLMRLSILCITFMAALVVSGYTQNIFTVLFIFLFANIFYQMGLVVYDAMLPFVTDQENMAKVSGFGVAIGYFGSFIGIGFGIVLSIFFGDFITEPKDTDCTSADPDCVLQDTFEIGYIPFIFPLAALMFLLFSLPILSVKEKPRNIPPKKMETIRQEVVNDVKQTGSDILKYRDMKLFLIGWLIYVDAANTVIAFMTPMVQIGLEFGEGSFVLIVLGIGILSAVVFTYPIGVYVDKKGPRKGLIVVTSLWIISFFVAFFTNLHYGPFDTPKWPLYVFPIILGPGLGGTWVVGRQFVTELSPPEKVGNYFGFANIFGSHFPTVLQTISMEN